MNAATNIVELASAIATGAADVFSAPAVALVGEPDGALRRALVADPALGVPVCDTAPAHVLRALQSLQSTSVSGGQWRLFAPQAADGPQQAVLYCSRTRRSPVCIAVGLEALQAEQHDLLVQLGHAAVLTVDSLRLHLEEHSLALTLQRSFLPDKAPELPDLQIAVRYVPAASNAEIGGDFYELVELDGGKLLVAVGDVAGHSIHAATVMVELRHALRAFAVEGHAPAEILDKLERVLRHFHPTEFAMLCLVEDRVTDLDHGMEQLRAAMSFPVAPEQLCDTLIERFGQDKADDVTLLMLRRS